jgi:hypothetical protein
MRALLSAGEIAVSSSSRQANLSEVAEVTLNPFTEDDNAPRLVSMDRRFFFRKTQPVAWRLLLTNSRPMRRNMGHSKRQTAGLSLNGLQLEGAPWPLSYLTLPAEGSALA